jgi:hypothetical protein
MNATPEKNYFIYCLYRGVSCGSTNMTLSEAYKELKHVGGFGIANNTTGLPIIRRTTNGFTLPSRLSEKYPKIESKLIRSNHMFY